MRITTSFIKPKQPLEQLLANTNAYDEAPVYKPLVRKCDDPRENFARIRVTKPAYVTDKH